MGGLLRMSRSFWEGELEQAEGSKVEAQRAGSILRICTSAAQNVLSSFDRAKGSMGISRVGR